MIQGRQTYLRPPTAADAEIICIWENDPEIRLVSEHEGEFSVQDIRDFLQSSKDLFTDRQLRLMICKTDSHQALGAIDLFDFNAAEKKTGIGILIGEAQHRSQGFASDALKSLLKFCIEHLKITCFECLIFTDNLPSIRLFERAGFKTTGVQIFKEKKAFRYTYSV
jgi:diamine N-acetyltransferase